MAEMVQFVSSWGLQICAELSGEIGLTRLPERARTGYWLVVFLSVAGGIRGEAAVKGVRNMKKFQLGTAALAAWGATWGIAAPAVGADLLVKSPVYRKAPAAEEPGCFRPRAQSH